MEATTLEFPFALPEAAPRTQADFRRRTEHLAIAATYTERVGVLPEKVSAAQQDIFDLLELAFSATNSGNAQQGERKTPELSPPTRADQEAALRSPTDPEALRRGFGSGTRISSIIPELVRDTSQSWDITGATVACAEDVAVLMQAMRSPFVETMKLAVLDDQNRITRTEILSIGAISQTLFNPGMIARVFANQDSPSRRFILSHNHPSGDPSPSAADINIQRKVYSIAHQLGYELVDHVITNGSRYHSFAEHDGCWADGYHSARAAQVAAEAPERKVNQALGRPADWEVAPRDALHKLTDPDVAQKVIGALRQVDASALYVIYANVKNGIVGFERFTDCETRPRREINKMIFEGMGREGATALAIALPGQPDATERRRQISHFKELAEAAGVTLLDVFAKGEEALESMSRAGMLEEPASYTVREALPDALRPKRSASLEQYRAIDDMSAREF